MIQAISLKLGRKSWFKTSNILLSSIIALLVFGSCHNRNKNTSDFKPMKPSGSLYSAYNENGNWALEMDLNGDFHFQDYVTGYEILCKSSEYIGKKEGYKQKLEWNMFNGKELEQEVKFTILQENCYNFGFVNNPFTLEVYHDGGLIYRLGDCGTFHNEPVVTGNFAMHTVNGKDAKEFYNLKEIPNFEIKKTKTSNMVHGRFACRFWQGQVKLLDKSMFLNYNIHPTDDCIETPELTKFAESMGNKKFLFDVSKDTKKRTLLTLSDKYDTFVFVKTD